MVLWITSEVRMSEIMCVFYTLSTFKSDAVR